MVKIDKKQAELIRKLFPWVHVRRTVHSYYMEENDRAMRYVGKGGGSHREETEREFY